MPTQLRRPSNFAVRIGLSSGRRALGMSSFGLAPVRPRTDATASHDIAYLTTRSRFDPELQNGRSLVKLTAYLFPPSKTNGVRVSDIPKKNVDSRSVVHEK